MNKKNIKLPKDIDAHISEPTTQAKPIEVIKIPTRRRIARDKDMTLLTNKHKSVITKSTPLSNRAKLNKLKNENSQRHEYEPEFVWEEYQNLRSCVSIPINNIWIDALAKEMTKWIDENVDAIRFDEFLQQKAMLENEFRRLMAKSAILQRAYKYVLAGIARNREVGAWKRGKNWQVASYNLPYYCDITREESERKAKLRESTGDESGTKYILLPSVEAFEKEINDKKDKE